MWNIFEHICTTCLFALLTNEAPYALSHSSVAEPRQSIEQRPVME